MTNNIKNAVLVFLAVTMSFALGWCARGDLIYGAMYKKAYDNPAINTLAEKIGK